MIKRGLLSGCWSHQSRGVLHGNKFRQPTSLRRQLSPSVLTRQLLVTASHAEEASDKRKNPDLYEALGTQQGNPAGRAGSKAAMETDSSSTAGTTISYMLTSRDAVNRHGSSHTLTKPEVLAPVGGWPQVIHNFLKCGTPLFCVLTCLHSSSSNSL